MLSKKTKITLGLASLCLLCFFTTSAFAASYSYTGIFIAETSPYNQQFRVTADLDVTTEEGSLGLIIITYNKDNGFWSTYHYEWFWKVNNYQLVDVSENIQFTYNVVKEKIAVKYTLIGKVRYYNDYSKYVMIKVWVKIWADGVKTRGGSYWDDNFGNLDYWIAI